MTIDEEIELRNRTTELRLQSQRRTEYKTPRKWKIFAIYMAIFEVVLVTTAIIMHSPGAITLVNLVLLLPVFFLSSELLK